MKDSEFLLYTERGCDDEEEEEKGGRYQGGGRVIDNDYCNLFG